MVIVGYATSSTTGAVSALYMNDFSVQQTTIVDITTIFRTRNTCTNNAQPYCLSTTSNWGIRIEGNVDTVVETLKQKLKVSNWAEPDYSIEDQVSPTPRPIAITANLTISGVVQGKTYSILRFDSYSDVPASSFATSTRIAWKYCFTAPATGTYTLTISGLMSDKSYFYRTINKNICTPINPPSVKPTKRYVGDLFLKYCIL